MPENTKELWDAVLTTGTVTALDGTTRTFTEHDLDTIQLSYDPTKGEAPLVIGHPKLDSPAWGWVAELKRKGKTLFARYTKLAPEFVSWVKDNRYTKKSVKLMGNQLIHVGYLGATPPAVPGLPTIALALDNGGTVFEFASANPSAIRRLFMGIRDLLIEKFGIETADKAVPSWDIDNAEIEDGPANLYASPVSHTNEHTHSTSTDGGDMTELEKIQAELEELKAKTQEFAASSAALAKENGDLKAKVQEFETAAKAAAQKSIDDSCVEFASGLISQRKLKPCDKETVVATLKSLLLSNVQEFAAADGSKKSPAEAYKAMLLSGPEVVSVQEFAAAGSASAPVSGTAGVRLDAAARAEMNNNKELTYTKALLLAQQKNPELVKEYQVEAGIAG